MPRSFDAARSLCPISLSRRHHSESLLTDVWKPALRVLECAELPSSEYADRSPIDVGSGTTSVPSPRGCWSSEAKQERSLRARRQAAGQFHPAARVASGTPHRLPERTPRRRPGGRLAIRNWRVPTRLNAILLIPVLVALVFGGFQVKSSVDTWQRGPRTPSAPPNWCAPPPPTPTPSSTNATSPPLRCCRQGRRGLAVVQRARAHRQGRRGLRPARPPACRTSRASSAGWPTSASASPNSARCARPPTPPSSPACRPRRGTSRSSTR